MSKNLEKEFLQHVLSNEIDVHIFLVSGIKLVGKLGGYDDTCILLKNTISQVVYKSAISTIVPQAQIDYSKF